MKEYFQHDKKNKVITYQGTQSLTAFVPRRFETSGCLKVGETVSTLGVFDMKMGDKPLGLFVPGIVNMEPSGIELISNPNGDDHYNLVFNKGDVFLRTHVVKDANVAYIVFRELIFLGRMLEIVDYDLFPRLFEIMGELCGINFGVNRVIFELMAAYMYRNPEDLSVQHRHTGMKSSTPVLVALSNKSVLAETTTSKLLGSGMDDTMNAAMVETPKQTTKYEQILRE